jgi:hypothetical protein
MKKTLKRKRVWGNVRGGKQFTPPPPQAQERGMPIYYLKIRNRRSDGNGPYEPTNNNGVFIIEGDDYNEDDLVIKQFKYTTISYFRRNS